MCLFGTEWLWYWAGQRPVLTGLVQICNFCKLQHWFLHIARLNTYLTHNHCSAQGMNRVINNYMAPKRLFWYLHHVLSTSHRVMACLSFTQPSLSRIFWYLTVIFLTQKHKCKFLYDIVMKLGRSLNSMRIFNQYPIKQRSWVDFPFIWTLSWKGILH